MGESVFLIPGQGADPRGVLAAPAHASDRIRHAAEEALTEAQEVVDADWPVMGLDASRTAPPSLREILLEPSGSVRMGRGVPQLASHALSVVVARALMASGVHPVAVVGQSFGEIAALVCAGALDVADGVRAVCALNAAFEPVEGAGAMALLPGLGEHDCLTLLADVNLPDLVLACVNAPEQTVVSGPLESVEALEEVPGLKVVRIPVPYASHHPGLGVVADRFLEGLRPLPVRPLSIPVYSPVAGRSYTDTDDLRRALADCVVKPVNLPPTLRRLAVGSAGNRLFVELGAGDALTRGVRSTLADAHAVAALGDDPAWLCAVANNPFGSAGRVRQNGGRK